MEHMQPLDIALVQLNGTRHPYLPYGAGLLQAYVHSFASDPEQFHFRPLLPFIHTVEDAINALGGVDVAGFSTYVWNIQHSLAVARRLKHEQPETLIVFGGPQVPDHPAAFLAAHPYIDVVCHGEGEAVFLELLMHARERAWEQVSGISWQDAQGHFQTRPRPPRLRDLSGHPSPYLGEVFAPLLAQWPELRWNVLWETNRGCPFSCSFCDWGSATASKVHSFSLARLQAEAEWFVRHAIEFVFCCDANFGLLPRDEQLVDILVSLRKRWGYPHIFALQNSKNVTDRVHLIQRRLYQVGLVREVALSMQSLHPPTLKAIQRSNISLTAFRDLHQRFVRDQIPTYTDMILGLPEETYSSFVQGVETLLEQGQHGRIKFHNLSLLPNAAMAQPESRTRYGFQTAWVPQRHERESPAPDPDGIEEYQELVVATTTLSRAEWRQARVFAWLAEILHQNAGMLQVAAIALHVLGAMPYHYWIEAFIAPPPTYPRLHDLAQQLAHKAEAIQRGEPEFERGEQPPLHVWWLPGDFHHIRLHQEGIAPFLDEAYAYLDDLRLAYCPDVDPCVLRDARRCAAMALALQRTVPLTLTLESNVWEVWQAALRQERLPWVLGTRTYVKTWPGKPFTLNPV
jgi:tRNA A37 methylthiotransferase MiaB